jgi:hypothetical protein
MAASGANVNADVSKDCCLRWLDTKPAGSVVYVSFGTATRFSPAELREISRGLDLSGKNFVWAISASESTESSEWMPEDFAKLTANVSDSRGFIIRGWAPQTLILNHPALGGFMMHCGWNSVLEAVSAGARKRNLPPPHRTNAWPWRTSPGPREPVDLEARRRRGRGRGRDA